MQPRHSLGAKRASEQVGRGSGAFAMHVGGQELPMHDPRFIPGLALTYQMDATPGRHTQGGEMSTWPGMENMPDKYDYGAKGEFHRELVGAMHFVNSLGICQFAYASYPIETWTASYAAITGQEITWQDALRLGERIGNLRLAFNLREGINPLVSHKVPDIVVGAPPLEAGNLRGVTVDVQRQVHDYLEAAGWDPQTCTPRRARLRPRLTTVRISCSSSGHPVAARTRSRVCASSYPRKMHNLTVLRIDVF